MEPAKLELRQLLDFYVNGQSAEQQKQRKVDQEAIQMAIRSSAESASGVAVHYTPIEQFFMHLPAIDTAVSTIRWLLGS